MEALLAGIGVAPMRPKDVIEIVPRRVGRYQDLHLELDFQTKTLRLDLQVVRLTRKEYELLAALVESAGRVVTRAALLTRVWGYSAAVHTRTLDVHIRRLRRKLGSYSSQYIETIFGVGYRFQPVRDSDPSSRLSSPS